MIINLFKRTKAENTDLDLTIPNFRNFEDWILVGIFHSSNKARNEISSKDGHTIMSVNNKMEVDAVTQWSFKKRTRAVSSSLTAKMCSL